jgi:gluconolactonase
MVADNRRGHGCRASFSARGGRVLRRTLRIMRPRVRRLSRRQAVRLARQPTGGIIASVMEPRVIGTELGFTEGPVWTADGRLLVTSISHGCLYELGTGGASVAARTGGGPNGLTEGEGGVLYVAQNGGLFGAGERSPAPAAAGVQRVADGQVTHIAEGLDAPNDLCFGPDGRLYLTDPRGPATGENTRPGRLYAMELDGAPQLLAEGPAFINGLAFGPDPHQLYVAETFRQRVLLYQLQDGALSEPQEFCRTEPGFPDGLCFDEQGRLYVAATLAREVQVFDSDGQRVGSHACGDASLPTNCCFGGPRGRTLFVTDSAGGRVLAFELDVRGLPLYPFR